MTNDSMTATDPMLPIYAVLLAILCVSIGYAGGYAACYFSGRRYHRKPSTDWKRPKEPITY